MSGIGLTGQNPLAFQSHDSNTGGSNHSGNEEASPEKPVTTPRTPTERKRKRKTATQAAQQTQSVSLNPGAAGANTGQLPNSDPMGGDGHKTSKSISEYFPKRAPSSPVRGGTKSPLSFGSMYPHSPKTSQYASSPSPKSGTANNGPPSFPVAAASQPEYYPGAAAKPYKSIQTDLTMAELTKKAADLDSRDNRIGNVQLFVNLIFILYARWRFKKKCFFTNKARFARNSQKIYYR